MGSVNCYLVACGDNFILIDTGPARGRDYLVEELGNASCTPEKLKLVAITHADPDHTGNCAYLRNTFGVKVAMHRDESAAVERGDVTLSRKRKGFFKRILLKLIFLFFRLSKADRFRPDLYLDEDTRLSDYGLDAKVIHIPGHSNGSIGILLSGGEMFCGDLLENTKRPALNSLMDNKEAAYNSIEKLSRLRITTVYPGHGKPFSMQALLV